MGDDNISDEMLAAIAENCLELQCLSIDNFGNEISNKDVITGSNLPKLEKLYLRIYDETVNGKIIKNVKTQSLKAITCRIKRIKKGV